MASIVVLGGCGTVGSTAVKTLAKGDWFSKIIIGDINTTKAMEIIEETHSHKLSAKKVDVTDPRSIKDVIAGSDVVLNCTGPFYKYVKTILNTVIDMGIDYVDICDDVDVTMDILDMDEAAKASGITALIGMGSSPGTTNLLARFASDNLLDSTESIDIYHAHGGEPVEGEGVIGHRFHCMSIDIPMFLDSELKTVRFFDQDGIALQEEVDFYKLGKGIRVYPYPHPEQVTIPRYIKTKRVTNKGTVLPAEYYDLIKDMCRLGLSSREPVYVKGQEVVPYDFAIAYILRQREVILKETNFGPQKGCVKVVVKGEKNSEYQEYVFSIASEGQALGEGTGIPAAMGAILLSQGKIKKKGILPPEACLDPMDFFSLLPKVITLGEAGGKTFEGVLVENIDKEGNVTIIDTSEFIGG